MICEFTLRSQATNIHNIWRSLTAAQINDCRIRELYHQSIAVKNSLFESNLGIILKETQNNRRIRIGLTLKVIPAQQFSTTTNREKCICNNFLLCSALLLRKVLILMKINTNILPVICSKNFIEQRVYQFPAINQNRSENIIIRRSTD